MITKAKPRGVPFQKGCDARRHLAGSKSKAALDFKAEFKRIFNEEVNVRKLVRTLLRKAEEGVPWAMQEAFDRGLGKAVQFTDNKFDDSRPTVFVIDRGDEIDEETGAVIKHRGYISPGEMTIDGNKPLEEERARIRQLQAGIRPNAPAAALGPRKGDPGPSARVLEQFEAEDARRLLEAGKEAQDEADKSEDYIDACEKA